MRIHSVANIPHTVLLTIAIVVTIERSAENRIVGNLLLIIDKRALPGKSF